MFIISFKKISQCSYSRILYWDVMPCSLLDTYISEQHAVSIFRAGEVTEPMCQMLSHSRRITSIFTDMRTSTVEYNAELKMVAGRVCCTSAQMVCLSLHCTIYQDLNSATDTNYLHPHLISIQIYTHNCITAEAQCKTIHTK
jgi:hypothetical protein